MPVDSPAQLDDAPLIPQQPPKGALRIIFLIVLADLFGFGVIIPLLPFYARKYSASDLQVGLLFSVFSVCQLVATPILGLMSDRFGRRPVLVLSQIGSVVGYILLGCATYGNWAGPTLGLILVYISRVIDGISGGNISTAQAYVSDVTTKENRAKGMGLLGAAFGIGFSLGPALGGLLGHYDVSYPAFAAAIFSAVAAVQTYWYLPESRSHDQSEASSEALMWLHPSRFKPIVTNLPLVQLLLIFFFSMMAFVMMESTFAIFLKDAIYPQLTNEQASARVGGFFGLAGLVIIIIQGGLIGRLTKLFGEWPLVILGPLLVSAAMLGMAEVGLRQAVWMMYVAIIMNAAGRSLQTPPLSALTSHAAPPEQQGATFGLFHMLGSLARVIGPVIATGVYTKHHVAPFLVAGAMTFAIAVWTVLLRNQVNAAQVQVAPG